METTKITVAATIKASKSTVWNCYTQPEHIVNWNFATPEWQCPSATNDMRVGGKYMARMEAKDGSFGFDFEAIYNEINAGESFKYTAPDGRVVDVSFQENGESTNVTIIFDAEKENSIELQQNGWQAILNNFKNYVENGL